MTHEMIVAQRWLYQTLAADTALMAIIGQYGVKANIHEHPAPAGATYPLVTFQSQAPNDVRGVGTVIIMVKDLYLVRVTAQVESYATLDAPYARIHAVLHGARGPVAGGTMVGCIREQPWAQKVFEQSRWFCSLGGIYRVFPQSS